MLIRAALIINDRRFLFAGHFFLCILKTWCVTADDTHWLFVQKFEKKQVAHDTQEWTDLQMTMVGSVQTAVLEDGFIACWSSHMRWSELYGCDIYKRRQNTWKQYHCERQRLLICKQ